MNAATSFLPYQKAWIADTSQQKFCIKSRRIGMTYCQSYEDVEDCIAKKVERVYFSSADETAAKEYVEYCEMWAKKFNKAAKIIGGNDIVDEEKGIKTLEVVFSRNHVVYAKIHAMTSNPRRFRSKGGKVVLDEFDFHDDPIEMWRAAFPSTTWGFPIRVLSSLNGKRLLWKFVEDCETGKMEGSPHKITIYDAVNQGLADKIQKRKLTQEERQAWIDSIRRRCRDENTWKQEYCCEPIDESSAFLPYDLITPCEDNCLIDDLYSVTNDLYVGVDIGRKNDFTVIWVIELNGRMRITRKVILLKNMPFARQAEILDGVLKLKSVRRACIDATGLGMQMAENAQSAHGRYKVEAITFNGKIKEEIAYKLRTVFEDKVLVIPSDESTRDDFHSIRKVTTSSNSIRFDVAMESTDGHADRFWACALANHAITDTTGPINAFTEPRISMTEDPLIIGHPSLDF